MNGIQLAARFSLATNRLKYCGPADAEPILYRAITDGTDLDRAETALSRFEALEPYLRAIARKHGKAPFDFDVVEAYWIGNDLLEAFVREDLRAILHDLAGRGLPRAFVARISEKMPDRPFPHHAFHVMVVGVGAVTGKVATTLPNMESCRPGWGRVARVDPGLLVIEERPLLLEDGALRLGEPKTVPRAFDPRMLPGIGEGDWVGLHWGVPVAPLSTLQAGRLEGFTRRSIDAANAALTTLRPA